MSESAAPDADKTEKSEAPEDEVEASRAPLIDHIIELRTRLIQAMIAVLVAFVVCFVFAQDIYNVLVIPFEWAAGPTREVKLIYTAPQEFFITQIKVALFGAIFFAFPVIAVQIYKFVAPGLYKHERGAFIPYVDDAAAALFAGAKAAPGAVYEVGDERPEGHAWREIGETLGDVLGKAPKAFAVPRPVIAAYHGAVRAAEGALGRVPSVREARSTNFSTLTGWPGKTFSAPPAAGGPKRR